MTARIDANGRDHADDGRFVSMRDLEAQARLVDRVFEERKESAEFAREQLEKALIEARNTTERAMQEAKSTTDRALVDAKNAADSVNKTIFDRLEKLESGGAPFANRLDEGVSKLRRDVDVLESTTVRSDGEEHRRLKHDVETLNTDAVRTKVLDALRAQTQEEVKANKKRVQLAIIGASVSFAFSLILAIANYISSHGHTP
jgi:hypothetical protein